MSEQSRANDRAVWFDIPVVDLQRAGAFYRAVLACGVDIEDAADFQFGVLEHGPGNGGCLVPGPPEAIGREGGVLLYLGVEGRLRDAVVQVKAHGGEVLEDVHPIGPHGHRAVVRDSEGNRVALHSSTDP